jgi:Zn-dependent protease with chaperone function
VTAPVILLGYALLVGTVGAGLLQRSRWPHRAPLMGILAWQAMTTSVVLSVILAGIALALPTLPLTADLASWLHACALALRAHYATPGGAALAAAGAVLAASVTARVLYCVATGWSTTRRRRRQQRHGVRLIAHRHAGSGALVVPHETALVYCMPGRRGQVVLTSGAIEALDGAELTAVLAHERAHLRMRHDTVLAAASVLRAAFPFVPVFRLAYAELARLVEMHADDVAVSHGNRRPLATALVTLAGAAHPAGTLAAGGGTALARVQRLAQPIEPLGIVRSALVASSGLVMLTAPLLIAAAPAAAAAAMDYCPVMFPA